MADVAKYIRIFAANPTDEFAKKRANAINLIEAAIKKKNSTTDIFELANNLLLGIASPSEVNDYVIGLAEKPLRKNSDSFIVDGEQLQLLTCSLIATLQLLEKIKKPQHRSPECLLAIALFSGLSFQKINQGAEKFEQLRTDLLNKCKEIFDKITVNSRERVDTPTRMRPPMPEPNTWGVAIENFEKSYGTLIDAVRINSQLDREEIDILWWLIGGWSSAFSIKISDLNSPQSAIVSSYEIGLLLRRFPNVAHAHIACRGINPSAKLDSDMLIAELDFVVDRLKEEFAKVSIANHYSQIFPLIQMLLQEAPFRESEFALVDWSHRMMLEMCLINADKFLD